MRQIKLGEDISGKTIVGAVVREWEVILNLGGGDFLCIEPAHDYDDGVKLDFDGEPRNLSLLEAGVISQKESDAIDLDRAAERVDRTKTQDLANLQRLMKKYPEWTK